MTRTISQTETLSVRAALTLILVATAMRVVVFAGMPDSRHLPPFSGDGAHYFQFAEQLANGEDYTDGNRARRLATAALPPLYPLFIAGFLKTIGFEPIVFFGAQILLSAAVAPMTFFMARWTMSDRWAMAAAMLVALSPSISLFSAQVLTEAIFIPLLTLTTVTLMAATQRRTLSLALAAGLACGATMMSRNVAGLLWVPLAGTILMTVPWRRAMAMLLFMALGCCLVWAPWFTHRYLKYGELRPAQGDQASTLMDQYATMAYYGFAAEPDRVPFLYADVAKAQARYDELVWEPFHQPNPKPPVTSAYFRDHPMAYLKQSFWRAFQFFQPRSVSEAFGVRDGFAECLEDGRYGLVAMKAVMLLLAVIFLAAAYSGFFLALPRWKQLAPLYAIFLYFSAVHVLVHATTRYRFPLVPILAVFAVHAAIWFRGRVSHRKLEALRQES